MDRARVHRHPDGTYGDAGGFLFQIDLVAVGIGPIVLVDDNGTSPHGDNQCVGDGAQDPKVRKFTKRGRFGRVRHLPPS